MTAAFSGGWGLINYPSDANTVLSVYAPNGYANWILWRVAPNGLIRLLKVNTATGDVIEEPTVENVNVVVSYI